MEEILRELTIRVGAVESAQREFHKVVENVGSYENQTRALVMEQNVAVESLTQTVNSTASTINAKLDRLTKLVTQILVEISPSSSSSSTLSD